MKKCDIYVLFALDIVGTRGGLKSTNNLCFKQTKKNIYTTVYPSFDIHCSKDLKEHTVNLDNSLKDNLSFCYTFLVIRGMFTVARHS